MQLNEVDLLPVISIRCGEPVSPSVDDRYIVGTGSAGDWADHEGDIATWTKQVDSITTDSTSFDGTSIIHVEVTTDTTSYLWIYTEPKSDQMVYVEDEDYKYIYSDLGWVKPLYMIPLQISLDIFREETYTSSLGSLTQAIREALVAAFEDRFGINAEIYRSEIIDVVQEVEGVDHCSLLDPVSNIFFNFDINNFTQTQLLEYAPEYLYFTVDDIAIRIF